ncbi:MAG: right-handed parallel beta-helix repeat-containing protein [Candidatus Odinarchaeota archaeon]|nr:right-handed parallel beta-helix repeat-containing protein [Candidatus Odinarchaeota archaeon]
MKDGKQLPLKNEISNNNTKRLAGTILVVIILFSVLYFFIPRPMTLGPPPMPPPPLSGFQEPTPPDITSEDWVINTTVILENKSQPINKNIFVMPNGTLIIKNSQFFMEGEVYTGRCIVVYPGGNLTIIDSTFTSYDLQINYFIYVDTGAALLIQNSNISWASELFIKGSNISIKNSFFRKGHNSVVLRNVKNATIENSTFSDYWLAGVGVIGSTNIKITNNFFSDCFYGVHVENSRNVDLRNNSITETRLGIDIQNSTNCTVEENQLNHTGLTLFGENYTALNLNIRNNTVNGLPLVFVFNQENVAISSQKLGQIIIAFSKHVELKNVSISNTSVAIFMLQTSNISITECDLKLNINAILLINCEHIFVSKSFFRSSKTIVPFALGDKTIDSSGINILDGHNITISNNDFPESIAGVALSNCGHISIVKNHFNNSRWKSVSLENCSNIVMSDNIIENSQKGAFVYDCSNITFSGNLVKNNFEGITFERSKKIEIDNNTIVGNRYGIYLHSCEDSSIAITSGNTFRGNRYDFYSVDVGYKIPLLVFIYVLSVFFIVFTASFYVSKQKPWKVDV